MVMRPRPGVCQRFLNFGSRPLFVIGTDPSGQEDSFAEQVEVGSAAYLPFGHFDPVDVAFDHPGAVWQGEAVEYGVVVAQ
jgi:hypothetical protein